MILFFFLYVSNWPFLYGWPVNHLDGRQSYPETRVLFRSRFYLFRDSFLFSDLCFHLGRAPCTRLDPRQEFTFYSSDFFLYHSPIGSRQNETLQKTTQISDHQKREWRLCVLIKVPKSSISQQCNAITSPHSIFRLHQHSTLPPRTYTRFKLLFARHFTTVRRYLDRRANITNYNYLCVCFVPIWCAVMRLFISGVNYSVTSFALSLSFCPHQHDVTLFHACLRQLRASRHKPSPLTNWFIIFTVRCKIPSLEIFVSFLSSVFTIPPFQCFLPVFSAVNLRYVNTYTHK